MNIQPDNGQNSGSKDTGHRTEAQSLYIREPNRDDAGDGDASAEVREARARAHQRRHGDRKAAADRPTN